MQGGDLHTLKMVRLMMSEWIAATPLTALLPTTAKYAMFTSLHMPRLMPQEAMLLTQLLSCMRAPANEACSPLVKSLQTSGDCRCSSICKI